MEMQYDSGKGRTAISSRIREVRENLGGIQEGGRMLPFPSARRRSAISACNCLLVCWTSAVGTLSETLGRVSKKLDVALEFQF